VSRPASWPASHLDISGARPAPEYLAMHGMLHCSAGYAAARAGDRDRANDLLTGAEATVRRLADNPDRARALTANIVSHRVSAATCSATLAAVATASGVVLDTDVASLSFRGRPTRLCSSGMVRSKLRRPVFTCTSGRPGGCGECAGQRGGGVALDDDHGGLIGSQAPVQCRDHVTELCFASLVAVASGCEVLELDAEGGDWMTRVSGLSRLMIGASLISSARVPARRPVVPGCRVGIVR